MTYIVRKDGEGWEIRNRVPFKIACCDCGLVHNMVIVAPGKRRGAVLGIAAERNRKATGGKRSKGDFVKIYPLEKMTKQEIDALYP